MAQVKTPRKIYWLALSYALVYGPTLALVNSIVFAHVPDATRHFPQIRLLETIGWIVAGMSLKFLLSPGKPVNNRPLLLAAALSAVLGVFAMTLPNTPPNPESKVPFSEALELFGDPSFAVVFGVSSLITIALAFYFSFTDLFLESHVGVRPQNVGPLMTIGQWMEIVFMLLLPWFLTQWGMKWVLVCGMGIAIRIVCGRPALPLIVLGIALHGICFDFFFAAGFIHVKNTAPEAIRASGQSLFGVLTYGFGMWLGTETSGRLNDWFTTDTVDPDSDKSQRRTNWRAFWLIPCAGVALSLFLFLLLFSG